MSGQGSRDAVRAIHNAVAESPNDAQASTRPPETTAAELCRMVKDVLTKLTLEPAMVVLEIGCGTGLLAVPIAHRCRRFVGMDFAEKALAVLARRLHDEGLDGKATLVCLDVLSASEDELASLGEFDRVLVYAVLQCAADDGQAQELMQRAVRLVRPGGLAFFGNLPVAELLIESAPTWTGSRGARARRLLKWILTGGTPLPRSLAWKIESIPFRVGLKLRKALRRPAFDPQRLPPRSTVRLTMENMERWLGAMPDVREYRWVVPRVATPSFMSRADLLVWVR